ncbi:phosphate-starvation-inducible PsiE family protein [Mycobacterium sp. pW049]|uniref:phosphate-starvation-inducible PsiE family protein n=1 Tax=[Mycobacterium] bulgaricum TaxID=3238985 RepID=UPI00351AD3DC
MVRFRDRVVDADLAAEPLTGVAVAGNEEEKPEERQRLADRVLSVIEDAIYWAIAVMLVIGSGALLVSQFNTMLRLRNTPANTIMLEILDGLLLIFIFVELLYAVRTSLRSHEIAVEPFLIVGMLAGIKEIVVLSVEAATLLDNGPNFARAVVEIGVLGGVVLILAVAAFILRGRRSGRADPGAKAVEEESPAPA